MAKTMDKGTMGMTEKATSRRRQMMMMMTVFKFLIKMMQKTHLLMRMCRTYTENGRRSILGHR